MTTLEDQVRRAAEVKKRGGLGLHDGLIVASLLPDVETLAGRLMSRDSDLTEAEALAEGAAAREVALEVLEEILTGELAKEDES